MARKKVRARTKLPPNVRPKKRKKRNYPEFEVQKELATLLRYHYPNLLWYAIPNGGMRSLRDAKRFKDMGVRAGVWDIHVAEPTPIYPGLYIEMKAPGKYKDIDQGLSEDQKTFKEMALERGYYMTAHDNAREALRDIEEYLGIPQNERKADHVSF